TAVLTCKGCNENCVICGGSAAAFRKFYGRDRPVFRSPEAVVNNVKQIEKFSTGPIFILGDLLQAGEDYAVGAIAAGVLVLIGIVIKDRIKKAKTDDFKEVEK
ncbi:unnamed protein product, partial [marine sediment metagenome]